jgi:pyrroloquinoline quinone biosynthesis protein D
MTETSIPKKNERVAARVVEGKALIVVIDNKQLHTLNEVGTRVWELCDGRSLDQIAEAMVGEFEVDKPTALRDVQRFVEQLHALGALELEGRP